MFTSDQIPFAPPPSPAVRTDEDNRQLGGMKSKLEKVQGDKFALEQNQKRVEALMPEAEEKFKAAEQAAIVAPTDENTLAHLVTESRRNLFKSFMANADLHRAELEKTGDGLLRFFYSFWKKFNPMALPPGFITGGRLDQKISGALAEIEKILKK